MLVRTVTIVLGLTVGGNAVAQEPSGCDKFRWPIVQEQALLKSASATAAAGQEIAEASGAVLRLKLAALDQTTLPMPPERAPRDNAGFAGL